ncbi:thiopeptide-type bacteriocin biosynthesis protein [Streptomyces violascens]|uniref:thiopeptide-type bacteriocin biosynthesis protein n=1 Tax=Streptomyces violascens TaxID=67381 RepID=UPI003687201E
MSADRLIQATGPDTLGVTDRAVLDVLAGQEVTDVAHQAGLEPSDLANAVEVFQQAGHEALAKQAARTDWWQVYVEFSDWGAAERTAVAHLLPLVCRWEESNTINGWWFTRKHPCWRLRLHIQPELQTRLAVGCALDRLVEEGHLRRWWPGIYEPETAAFGGLASMTAAHYLFVADSREILSLTTRNDVSLGRRELSILLCTVMMRAARLEWYEMGDVWQRVISEEQRASYDGMPNQQVHALAEQLRTLLLADTAPDGPALASGGPMEPVTPWANAFRDTGFALAEAVRFGSLDRGLRRVLALHVIFHWNRLGLSMGQQSALAWAARTAILDPPGASWHEPMSSLRPCSPSRQPRLLPAPEKVSSS